MKCLRRLFFCLAGCLAVSCSTTRVLSEGEYQLVSNRIKADDSSFDVSELTDYVRQKPNTQFLGLNPAVSIYNWGGTSDTPFSRFLRKIGTAPVVYDASKVQASIENMQRHLEYIGYYGSVVESRVEVKGKKVSVSYFVSLGKRYKISEITYQLPASEEFRADFEADRANISLRPGQYLSEAALETESERSAKYFREQGYFGMGKNFYSFEADTLSSDGTATLKMCIEEYSRTDVSENARPHRKYNIGRVDISYPADITIRPWVLENLVTLYPGQRYDERNVSATYSRLANLSAFNSVNISMNPVSDEVVDCDIRLQHGGLQGFKTNLEASVNSTGLIGISPQLTYTHKNFFHGGEVFNIGLKGNFQFKPGDKQVRSTEFSTSASLRFPEFLGLPNRLFRGTRLPHTDLNLAFSYQNRPEYIRTQISTSFGYIGSWGENLYYQLYPFQLSITHLSDMNIDFIRRIIKDMFMIYSYTDHFDMGVGGTVLYTTDPSALPAGSYHYYRLSTDISGNALSLFNRVLPTEADGGSAHTIWGIPYSQYARVELTAARTIRFGKDDRQALAYRLNAGLGYAYGNSTVLPFEKQFYVGGASSMRGWQARTLGPGTSEVLDYFLIPSQTGDIKLEANLEYRFPMFWKLEGALFADAGNVWRANAYASDEEEFSWENLGESIGLDWGLGIRVNLNFILVRLDIGFKAHDPSRTERNRWLAADDWGESGNYTIHFGVGYPF